MSFVEVILRVQEGCRPPVVDSVNVIVAVDLGDGAATAAATPTVSMAASAAAARNLFN